jgi:hypothetical protein
MGGLRRSHFGTSRRGNQRLGDCCTGPRRIVETRSFFSILAVLVQGWAG